MKLSKDKNPTLYDDIEVHNLLDQTKKTINFKRIAWSTSCFASLIIELVKANKLDLDTYVLCPTYQNSGKFANVKETNKMKNITDNHFEKLDINPCFTETCQIHEFQNKKLINLQKSLKRLYQEECHSKINIEDIQIVARNRSRKNVVASYECIIALGVVKAKNLNILSYTPQYRKGTNVYGQKVSSVITGTYDELLNFINGIQKIGYKNTHLGKDGIIGYSIVNTNLYIKAVSALSICAQSRSNWKKRLHIYFKYDGCGTLIPIGGSKILKISRRPRTKSYFRQSKQCY